MKLHSMAIGHFLTLYMCIYNAYRISISVISIKCLLGGQSNRSFRTGRRPGRNLSRRTHVNFIGSTVSRMLWVFVSVYISVYTRIWEGVFIHRHLYVLIYVYMRTLISCCVSAWTGLNIYKPACRSTVYMLLHDRISNK